MKKRVVGTAGALAAGMLTWTTTFGGGVAAADTALIVPGTQPSPNPALRKTYHFKPSMEPQIGANYYNPGATRQIVPYPGSVWPITGWNSPTVNSSVSTGTRNLDSAIRGTTDGQPIYVAGLSQGTLALDREQARLAHDPSAPPPGALTFIKAGDPNNLLTRAFAPGTHVPILDLTVPAPLESQYRTINIVGQYDPFSDPPTHPGNLLADINAVTAAGYYGHSATAFSDPARVAPWDIKTSTNSLGGTTTTYFIRSGELPLVRALVDSAGLPPESAGPLSAVLRPMIDRAYGPGVSPGPAQWSNGVNALTHIPIETRAITAPVQGANIGLHLGTGVLGVANLARNGLPNLGAAQPAAAAAGGLTHAGGPLGKEGHKGGGLLPRVVRALLPGGKK